MKSAGIICEYDPFHKGHYRQIEMLRERGFDTVVCLMSGNSTQRGCFACADKYTRAHAATVSGADIVLELPYPYSSASSEYFASAGVYILDRLGVDEINFGSECGDTELLKRAAKTVSSDAFNSLYISLAEKNKTKGALALYCEAYKTLTGDDFPTSSNDLLGIAYMTAAEKLSCKAELRAVKREGSSFSDTELREDEYPSATGIRELFLQGNYEKAFSFSTEGCANIYRDALERGSFPTDVKKLESAILSYFRLAPTGAFESFAECSGGLSNRIVKASDAARDLDGLFSLCATKKYTDARIRRAILFAMTGVLTEDLKALPRYTVVLSFNGKGREFLSDSRKSRGIEVVTRQTDAPECRQKELTQKLDALFTLTLPKVCASDEFSYRFPKICEND